MDELNDYKGVVLGGIPRERVNTIKNLGIREHATCLNMKREETGHNYSAEFSVKGPYMEEFVSKSLDKGYASCVYYLDNSKIDKEKIDNYIM